MSNSNLVSECHKAAMTVVGGDEGTNHYECNACRQPCNWIEVNGLMRTNDSTSTDSSSQPNHPSKSNPKER